MKTENPCRKILHTRFINRLASYNANDSLTRANVLTTIKINICPINLLHKNRTVKISLPTIFGVSKKSKFHFKTSHGGLTIERT